MGAAKKPFHCVFVDLMLRSSVVCFGPGRDYIVCANLFAKFSHQDVRPFWWPLREQRLRESLHDPRLFQELCTGEHHVSVHLQVFGRFLCELVVHNVREAGFK